MSRASATLFPSARGPKATLSCTVIQVKSAPCWNTTPRSGPGALIVLPSSVARPLDGASKPATMLSNVLLPQPEGPTIARNSPAPTAMSIGSSACTASEPAPKRLETPSTRSLAPSLREPAASAMGSRVTGLPFALRASGLVRPWGRPFALTAAISERAARRSIGRRRASHHLREKRRIDVRHPARRDRRQLVGRLQKFRLRLERARHARVFRARQAHPLVGGKLLRRDRM